ncbi:hypothetical protein [Rubinisphaera sp.]|uniref:ABC transporter permease n=1 Tax=Rubinisphaera sp. TaxID=2024857 RepID=UPI000C0D167A|nr:hypothetical protein [Rubinisphaera sp.]MBV09246.1 hypothetical protein [Rubinisphaera sp.]HCS50373.1 hypothetical protein [Planctomycetaceae bacterium]|tara:strand:+ start:8283 stop:9965 length:1683 start_codon:yes stop_codon:yes gene_type:complete
MSFDVVGFNFLEGLTHFLKVFGGVALTALIVSFILALIQYGGRGPGLYFKTLWQALVDFVHTSPRRVWAITELTWKESARKKALFVFVVFAILIMFAGWFLRDSVGRADLQLKIYVKFVLTAISWLTLPVILLLSCWGLPSDIKNRSLHTVVTKPIRRHEVVLGRFFGFTLVGTVILLVMGIVGYAWTVGQMPEAAKSELVGRVPVYGDMTYSNRNGDRPNFDDPNNLQNPASAATNVGDVWEFRSYIEGGTKSRTFYDFDNIDVAAAERAGQFRIEYNFEAFRTHKGDIEKRLLCRITIVNKETGLRVPLETFEVKEFSNRSADKTIILGGTDEEGNPIETITYREENTNEVKSVHIFDELLKGGDITVEVQCLDPGQFLGMARPDLFIRMPDRPFYVTFFKAVFGIWLQMVLIIVLGVTASCFVKGPVATLLTFGMLVIGSGFSELMQSLAIGTSEGGGPFESAYRMFMHLNPTVSIEDGPLKTIMTIVDQAALGFLWTVQYLFPQFEYYNMVPFVANGFDVPWKASLLPSILVTLAFVIPCLILGYFSMQLREMEAK